MPTPGLAFILLVLIWQVRNYVVSYPVSRFTLSTGNLVDLSYPMNAETVYWPNVDPEVHFALTTIDERVREDGMFYRQKWFKTAEHGGTHLDAPSHFDESGKDVSMLTPDQLMGPLVVINVTSKVVTDPDYEVTVDDIEAWESKGGRIPEGAFVFMFSNWNRRRYPDKARVFGSKTFSDITSLHFPGFHPDAVRFLVKERNVRGVGVDTPSVDHGQSSDFGSHVVLSQNDRIGLENVANMEKMPAVGGFVIALPLKNEGGTGSPVRLLGIMPNVNNFQTTAPTTPRLG